MSTTSSYISSSSAPVPTATADGSASSSDTSATRLAMIMSVAIASICLTCFVWQSIQSYKLLGKSKWSQLSVLAFCQCLLGTVYSLFTLAAYCLSMSCEVRAVAEVIIINISDVVLQVILMHRFYAIKRRKAVLFVGITFIVALLVYLMVALAAGDIQSFMVGNVCVTGSRKYLSTTTR
ncbi:hypothetical protein INT43_004754 [Umbelopsis isabellina]|uniref:Uncharacterized protein n=1 Tax=Mortierella isabellina TaxID=91625 RepID=A0A8H7PE33_MORIS|nr:hypothetical protein INT43_004754 [Umbelopsis isabellina]